MPKNKFILAIVATILFLLCILFFSVLIFLYFNIKLPNSSEPKVNPTLTPTILITNTIAPTRIVGSNSTFTITDTFDNNRFNWPLEVPNTATGSVEIANGKYVWDLTIKKNFSLPIISIKNNYTDFALSVDIDIESNLPASTAGLAFMIDPVKREYLTFVINPAMNSYSLYHTKLNTNEFIYIQPWGASDDIKITGTNTLKVVAHDHIFDLYINGVLQVSRYYSNIETGQVGLLIEMADKDNHAKFSFDNFTITAE